MSHFRPYPDYKDTGVEWLGEVPAHWSVDCVKWSVASCQNGVWGDDPKDDGSDVHCVRVADFDRHKLCTGDDIPTKRSVSELEQRTRGLNPGNLLLEKSGGGDNQPVGAVVLYTGPSGAVCSNFIARMELTSGSDPSFWRYMHFALYSVRINTRSIKQTSGIQNLDQKSYLQERVPFPPHSEQMGIANYLDRLLSRIDTLIERKTRFIELLKEKRQALITHAVTKGLNPDAPMKDSGIECLGEVPAHWTTGNIRRFAIMKTGHTPSRSQPEYWEKCTVPWFTLADVWQLREGRQKFLGTTKERISQLGLENSAAELLPAGTVVFSRTASVGFSGIMPRPMATSQDFWNWIPGEGLSRHYLLYLFRAMQQEFAKLTMGSTHKTVYQADAAGLAICLPPTEEQTAIVRHVESQLDRIDLLVDKSQQSIDLLKERRSTLISAAVTGKIDLRDAA